MAAPLPLEQQFATAVLKKWGRPVTATSVRNVIGWMRAEGGHFKNKARFNPLNTTQPAPGAGNTGSQGNIKIYRDFNQGVDATVQTLKNGRYGPIAAAVNSDPSTFARAVNSTPWGTKSDFSGISRSINVSGVSGGAAAPADAGAVPPAASASLPQSSAGQLDVKRLREILSAQTKRSLSGVMPAPGFRAELQKLAGQALPRALAVEGAQAVGTAAVGAAQAVGAPVGSPIAGQAPHASTHQTSGLPGYPAYDYMAPAGTRVGAPVSGTVLRLSGKDPRLGGAPGGPLGYSVYLRGDDGKTYFLTHIDKVTVRPGQKVKQGQQIAVVANGPKSWSSPHVHMGVNG